MGGMQQQRASLASPAVLLLLCCSLLPQPSRAFLGGRSAFGDGDGEEKVPMTVVASSYSPRPAPAPAPVRGSDDDDGDMPRLPSERWSPGAPSGGNAGAPAPAAGESTAFISSNPAVPLPAGVTDSASVLPMPTPGQAQRQDVGMGTLLQARTVPLAVPLLMMLFSWALWLEY